VKKKLAALDLKIQIGLVVFGLLIVGFVARSFVVSPQTKKAAALEQQLADVQTQIATRQAQARHGERPQPIEVADLFRLAKAMPDREDMPGIILTLSQVARESGIHFETIEPQDIGPAPVGNYRTRKIHLLFNGDFYALSDFLYRLRNLVTVHDGKLDANGRLFTVQTVTFNLGQSSFPAITADIGVEAYIYGTGPSAAAPAVVAPPGTTPAAGATTPATGTDTTSTSTTPTTTTPDSTGTDTSTPAGATAVGAPTP
jgi:Tfp pilus assembly protein PilO